MIRRAAATFVLLSAAVPAAAQLNIAPEKPSSGGWTIPAEAEPPLARPGVTLPVIDYTAPDGSLKLKRGIVAGVEVGPRATIGIGLFETLPKKHSLAPSDNPLERKPKRSRKAAVGFSLSF